MIAHTGFGSAAELREYKERAIQFFRHQLQPSRQLADLLIAVLRPATGTHQLEVIDNHQRGFGIHAPQLGVHVHEISPCRVINKQRGFHHLVRRLAQFLPFLLVEVAGAEAMAVHAGRGAQHTCEQGFLRHFERENSHRLKRLRRHMPGHIQSQRSLPHGGARRKNNQFAAVQSPGHFIEFCKAGADALDALAGVEEGVDAALVGLDHFAGSAQAVRRSVLAQLHPGLLGAGEDVAGVFLRHQRPVHQVLAGNGDLTENGLLAHDANVAIQIGDTGQAVVE